MPFGPIELLFNIVVMLFWLRLWNRDKQVGLVNPYVSGIENFTQPILDLFRPLLGSLNGWIAPLLAWSALIAFRAIALPFAVPDTLQQIWFLRFGFEIIQAQKSTTLTWFIFSALSFFIFLFQVWVFACCFLGRYRRGYAGSPTIDFLYTIARPCSDLKPAWRIVVALLFGFGVVVLMNLAGQTPLFANMAYSSASSLLSVARYAISIAAGVVDLLLALQSLIIILIIGSWVGIFTGSGSVVTLCQEWLDLFLGPFRRFPIHIGFLDLTPIIAFFAIGIVHWIARNLCLMLYSMMVQMGG